ncbi:hypothetical protein ACXX9E_09415 [Pseudomonas sp. GNP014]
MWWEKTVEYAFVQRFMPLSSTKEYFLAPLDGDHEKAGDAIFGQQSTFVLIEFKRAHNDLKSEIDKFFDYDSAKRESLEKDSHHLLVYGVAGKKKTNLDLQAQTYFSAVEVDLKKFAGQGITLSAFKNYLRLFLYHKNKDGNGGLAARLKDLPTDPGGLDYMIVTGIVSGRPRVVMSLKDFLSFFKRPDGRIGGYQPIKPQPSQNTTLKQETQELAVEITHE